MKVTFFYQHYWPDSPPYASMLRSIAEALTAADHHVHVLTGQPSYKSSDRASKVPAREFISGVDVQRLGALWGSGRRRSISLLQKMLFPLRALIALLVRRYVHGIKTDVIVAATIPPVANGLFAWLAARMIGSAFVYHMQDIYPEIGTAAGLWTETSVRHKVLLRIDTFICKRADRCIVLSDDMRNSLLARGLSDAKLLTVNNFMLETHDQRPDRIAVPYSIVSHGPRLVFAGNIGRFQGLELVLQGFLKWQQETKIAEHKRWELHFLGDGKYKNDLMAQARLSDQVVFHGHLAFAEASGFISSCDAGIVSLNPEIYKYAFPSKTLTYLGLGIPLLAVIEAEACLATTIESHQLGVASGGFEIENIVGSLDLLAEAVSQNKFDREKIRQYHDSSLGFEFAKLFWLELLSDLSTDKEMKVFQ